jgi:hypothetical protein
MKMEWERRLVSVAATALRRYHEGASSWAAFNALLDGVIRVTASHYGYIGRIVPREGKLTVRALHHGMTHSSCSSAPMAHLSFHVKRVLAIHAFASHLLVLTRLYYYTTDLGEGDHNYRVES